MASMPDGMGEDQHRERQHMRSVERSPGFTHDVVAISAEGEVLFETEALFPNETDDALDGYPEGEHAPEGVDHYEIRER